MAILTNKGPADVRGLLPRLDRIRTSSFKIWSF